MNHARFVLLSADGSIQDPNVPAVSRLTQEPGSQAPSETGAPARRGEPGGATAPAATDGTTVQQQPSPEQQPDLGTCLQQQLPYLLAFAAIFYFLILRPSQKQEKRRKEMLAGVRKGDRIVTSSGIHGEITSLSDDTCTLRVDQDVTLTLERSAIAKVAPRDEVAAPNGARP